MMLDYGQEEKLKKQESGNHTEHRIATVTAVSGNTMRLKFDGEDAASGKYYKGIVRASEGARVLCARVSGTYVVLGTIL